MTYSVEKDKLKIKPKKQNTMFGTIGDGSFGLSSGNNNNNVFLNDRAFNT